MKAGNYRIKWKYQHVPIDTYCDIMNQNNEIIASGYAHCVSGDHFSRDKGRKISLARALKDAQLSKEERRVIWLLYRDLRPNKQWR